MIQQSADNCTIAIVRRFELQAWDKIQMQPEGTFPESFLQKLPDIKWNFTLKGIFGQMLRIGHHLHQVPQEIVS